MTSFKLIQNAYYATISEAWKNESYTLLSIQVENTFATADIRVEVRIVPNGEWKDISVFDTSALDYIPMPITSAGVYEAPIEGIAEVRIRVVSVTGGSVNINGIFYDQADGRKIPVPATISTTDASIFGINSNIIVKGVYDVTYIDVETGNIVGYERQGNEATVNIGENYQRIEGGFLNKLIGVLPDSTRINGTYTEQAFDLSERALALSQTLKYGMSAPMCEVVTAVESKLYVSKTPTTRYGLPYPSCYIRKVGEAWSAVAYEINPATKEVLGFTAENGEDYEVQYFIVWASAQGFGIPTRFSPKVYTVQIKYGAYAVRGANKGRSSQVGWLYFIVPRAIFEANESMNGSQTSNSPNEHQWRAIAEDNGVQLEEDCPKKKAPLGYYLYVPCDPTESVVDIIVTGNGLTLYANKSELPPVKLVMKDGSLVQPDFTSLLYMSEDESIATVSPTGYVKGVGEGETYINVYVSKSNGMPLKAKCKVTVTSSLKKVTLNRSHISGL